MLPLFRTLLFLLFGLLAAFWDQRTLRVPHWISLGGLVALLLIGPRGSQLPALLWPLFALGPFRLTMPHAVGGGDLALSLMLAAYLGGPGWCDALVLSALLLLLVNRLRRGEELPGVPRRYPFAPFLVAASALRGFASFREALREAAVLMFGLSMLLLPALELFPESPGSQTSDSETSASAEEPRIVEMEFRDQPIREILLLLAAATERTIIPDQTVTGRASYFFSSIPLQGALEAFCDAFDLYLLPRGNGVTLVSRIRVRKVGEESYSLDAVEAPLATVLQRLSHVANTPIRAVALQDRAVSFHGGPMPLEELLTALLAEEPRLRVESRRTHILLASSDQRPGRSSELPAERSSSAAHRRHGSGVELRAEDEGRYSLFVRRTSLREVLDRLFAAESRSYLYSPREELPVEELVLRDRTFEEILAVLLDSVKAVARERSGYTEIVPTTGAGAHPLELSVPLHHWAPSPLLTLLGPELSGRLRALPDPGRNRVLLSGAPAEVARAATLLSAVDRRELEGTPFELLELRHTSASELLLALPSRFEGFHMSSTPDDSAILAALPERALSELREFVALFDREESTRFFRLTALRGEEFVERFGGEAGMPSLRSAPGGRGLVAWGKEGEIATLRELLLTIDRPARQIRYDLLILQRQHREGSSYDLAGELDDRARGGAVALSGMFDQLLTLRFDAIALLGHRLAATISRGLSEQSARLLADTTLYGLDGTEVAFTNTQTFRYRDLAYNEEEAKILPTGVTREITSGIRLRVLGEVVEQEQVRMRITAEYSKQGVELAEGDDPPPTSEKRVETTVRTEAGEPIILAGLLQREREEERRPLPLLHRIPLFKELLRPGRKDEEVTELVIYLVPHIERSETVGFAATVEELVESLGERGAR
ncbi:MAG: hypothetical protein ACLFPP_05105 [Spirochaetaceae bacterium]